MVHRQGTARTAEVVRRTFRRQHLEKFLPGLEKLGLRGLPDAVACAQYHYLSNALGGVKVEWIAESDTKSWVRYLPPRWIWDGVAVCAVPTEVNRAMLWGWHAHNGVTLGNDRLGFVATSLTTDGGAGLVGYYVEEDRPLAAGGAPALLARRDAAGSGRRAADGQLGRRAVGQGRAQLRHGLRALDAARAVRRARPGRRRGGRAPRRAPDRDAVPRHRRRPAGHGGRAVRRRARAPGDGDGRGRRRGRRRDLRRVLAPGGRGDVAPARRSRRGTGCGRASPPCTATRPASPSAAVASAPATSGASDIRVFRASECLLRGPPAPNTPMQQTLGWDGQVVLPPSIGMTVPVT